MARPGWRVGVDGPGRWELAIDTDAAVYEGGGGGPRRIVEAALKRIAEVKAMLQAHPEIDTDATLIVNFNEFAASSLNFFIYTFTRTVEWVHFHEVKQDVLLKVAAIIQAHGADIAFPTRTLHIESAAGEGQTDD